MRLAAVACTINNDPSCLLTRWAFRTLGLGRPRMPLEHYANYSHRSHNVSKGRLCVCPDLPGCREFGATHNIESRSARAGFAVFFSAEANSSSCTLNPCAFALQPACGYIYVLKSIKSLYVKIHGRHTYLGCLL